MVDSTKACESAYVDVDLVKNSKAKRVVILTPGEYVTGQYGEKLELLVEIDEKQKKWSPNKDCANSLRLAYGQETNLWVGKIVALALVMRNGKMVIAAMPTHGPKIDGVNPEIKATGMTVEEVG